MGKQRELFKIDQPKWVEKVWRSIPTAVRVEITAILAQMGRTAVGDRKQAEEFKEEDDE